MQVEKLTLRIFIDRNSDGYMISAAISGHRLEIQIKNRSSSFY